MTTKDAITHLSKELLTDDMYFYCWQANIAMAFKDECSRRGYQFPDLHDVANTAAKNFLAILIMER